MEDIQDEKQDSIKKQLEFISGSAIDNLYSHMNNISKITSNSTRTRKTSRKTIRRALSNPYLTSNVETLQQASKLFKVNSGVYGRFINYQSNILTNYHTIFPVNISKVKTKEKMEKAYLDTAMFLQKYSVFRTCPWIYSRTIEQGELYMYKIEDSNGIIHMEIPANLCKITGVINDVNRFAINLNKIDSDSIDGYPLEIQNAYKDVKSGKIKRDMLIDNEYFEVSNKGTAFSFNKYTSKGVPFYSSIFDDLMELEDMKDLKSSTAVINNLKIIHQLLPTDANGDVLMDFDVAKAYHRDTASKVPQGTTVVTNPMKMATVTLSDGNTKITNNVRDALDSIYDGAGISVELFNSAKSSNEAVASGTVTDSFIALELQRQIAAWLNYELATYNKKSGIWQIRFIEGMTHFNKESYVKLARESMSFGGDKLTFFACCGMTPLEAINTLKMEELLGINDSMNPVQSSHTASSGRPTKSDSGNEGGQSTQPLTEE